MCGFVWFSLRKMRAKVWKLRSLSQLFNTRKYATDLERLYHTVWRNYEKGQPFNHVKVASSKGVDVSLMPAAEADATGAVAE